MDIIEILSDTGLGKEMHSVVSQGRVEAIVTSKTRATGGMLIEEAAGLGKHGRAPPSRGQDSAGAPRGQSGSRARR